MKPLYCQDCHTTDPEKFRGTMRGRCYNCTKIRSANQPKLCKHCGEIDPTKFNHNNKSTCNPCYGKNQRATVNQLKEDNGHFCGVCKSFDPADFVLYGFKTLCDTHCSKKNPPLLINCISCLNDIHRTKFNTAEGYVDTCSGCRRAENQRLNNERKLYRTCRRCKKSLLISDCFTQFKHVCNSCVITKIKKVYKCKCGNTAPAVNKLCKDCKDARAAKTKFNKDNPKCVKCEERFPLNKFTLKKTVCDDCVHIPVGDSKLCRHCGCDDQDNFGAARKRVCNDCFKPNNSAKHSEEDRVLIDSYPLLWNRLQQTRIRAGNKNKEFTLTSADMINLITVQEGLCAYSEHPMDCRYEGNESVSIDQIDAGQGYTPSNTILCCAIINRMKYTLTVDELYMWANRLANVDNN